MGFRTGTVAAHDTCRSIAPAETSEFGWIANDPGVFIDHCGTHVVLMHSAVGQDGAVMVAPRGSFATEERVDCEFVVVRSHFHRTRDGNGLHQVDPVAALIEWPSHVLCAGHVGRRFDEGSPQILQRGGQSGLLDAGKGPWSRSWCWMPARTT